MNRACPICSHPSRAAIDMALARGASTPGLSATYELSEKTIQRHAAEHVGATHEAKVLVAPRTLAGLLADAHKVLDDAQWLASAEESVSGLVRVVGARVRLMEVEFGTKQTTTVVDPRQEWEALSSDERRERLVEMKHRLLELEAESSKGEQH